MKKIIEFIIQITLIAIPILFLQTTADPYDFNKQTFLAITVVIIIGILIAEYIKTKTINITITPFTVPVILFLLAALTTLFVNTPNKIESLLYPNGAGTILLVVIWFLLISNIIETHNAHKLLNALLLSASILSLMSLAQYGGIGANIIAQKNTDMANRLWTPAGSPLILTLFLTSILPYGIIRVLQYAKKEKNQSEENKTGYTKRLMFFTATSVLITITIAIMVVSLMTTARPIILPFQHGWAIAAETMKHLRTAILGVGQLNYLPAFTTGHTAAYNTLPVWNVRFAVSSSYLLQLITELGIIGLVTYAIIMSRFIRRLIAYGKGLAKKTLPYNSIFFSVSIAITLIFIMQIILPGNLIQTFVLFTLLGVYAKFLSTKIYTEKSVILFALILIASIVSLIITSVTIYRAYAAEYYFRASVNAALKNDTANMYKLQQNAIRSNPFIDKFHRLFSQTNLAYAIAIAKKKQITEDDKKNIARLLTQAVQSAKNAIVVSPTNVQNWENLGSIYRAMIGAVQQADAWTLQAYNQAIRLDPTNPNLYLTVGGVYYTAKNYDAAIQYFLQAINLKSDFANAYYNLAAAYREKKQWTNAAQAMQGAIANLPKNSEDRKKAQTELEEIQKNIPQQPNDITQGEQIENPINSKEEKLTTPVTLPSQAAPNDVLKEQVQKPTPSPTNQPTPMQ